MEAVEFSQTYYLKNATDMGISFHMSFEENTTGQNRGEQFFRRHIGAPPYKPRRSHLNARSSEFKPRSAITSVTVSGNATHVSRLRSDTEKRAKQLPTASSTLKSKQRASTPAPAQLSTPAAMVMAEDRRVGSVWDGFVVQPFGRKKGSMREWEWDEPSPQTVSEIVFSEDEDLGRSNEISQEPEMGDGDRAGKSRTGAGTGNSINESGTDRGGGCGIGAAGGGRGGKSSPRAAAALAPRGKSWMLVTKKMIEGTSPWGFSPFSLN
jgi:hypothetical protein